MKGCSTLFNGTKDIMRLIKMIKTAIFLFSFAFLSILGLSGYASENIVNVLGWNDFIAPDTNANFTKKTDIIVNYDFTDSSEIMEAKLITGKSGYDVAFPSSSQSVPRLIETQAIKKLDRSKIPNWKYLDPLLTKQVQEIDPGNLHAIIYQYTILGLGINIDKVKELLPNAPIDSLDLILKPENAKILSKCGIAFLDNPLELLETIINYFGFPKNTTKTEDLDEIITALYKIRPYIRYFHSSSYISDLASGDVCVVLGYSGDINQAAKRAKEIGSDVNIQFYIPKEGTEISFDMLTIPSDADHVDEAYSYINYLLDPKIMASISDYIQYPNAIPKSKEYMNPNTVNNKAIYPPQSDLSRTFMADKYTKTDLRKRNRLWTKFIYNK